MLRKLVDEHCVNSLNRECEARHHRDTMAAAS